jgi:hypothetical protein
MVVCPQRGDIALFVIKGKIVMKGIVESDGFIDGTAHQEHLYNKGDYRPHARPTEFAWIKIQEVGLSQHIRPTGQRTWAKFVL